MTCAEFKDQVMAYALGALEHAEAQALEAHLRSGAAHEGCAGALAEARATVAALDAGLPEVNERVWRGIEAELGASSAAPAASAPAASAPAARRGRARERAGWLVAAAAVLALVWTSAARRDVGSERDQALRGRQEVEHRLTAVTGERADCQRTLETLRGQDALQREALAMLEAADSRLVSLQPVSGTGTGAKALYSPSAKRAMVMGRDLRVPPGKALQLWVLRGKEAPIPAGFLRAAQGGAEGALALGELDRAALQTAPDAFAVSLEPEGGSASPTQVLMVGKLAG